MNLSSPDADLYAESITMRLLALTALALAAGVTGGAQSLPKPDLPDMNLEDLMNVHVTSVSKKEQRLSKAGAAVYVISHEDIRRSGATRIPDLLRMVPGLDVAQIDANTHAISIRGFNNRLANKVLVLIDGRTVYTPTTSGVYWDQQDVPLEDIERIEVIRGPGGTVWGANAMNGVINIITKSAADTQGGLVSMGGGSQETGRGLVQYGGRLGNSGAYRAYGNFFRSGNLATSTGGQAADRWHMLHGGFRSDWTLSPRDTLAVQGDFLQTNEGQTINVVFANALPQQGTFNDKATVGSGNLLGRWTRTLANGSDISLQTYYDRYNRVDYGVHETLDTVDFDFTHHIKAGRRHDIVWGSGYRVTRDDHIAGYGKTYVPLQKTNMLLSSFVQDEVTLTNSLLLTVGSKFERNAYTGFEYEPSAQLVWTPGKRHALWLSAGRAIRQPSREDDGLRVDLATFPLENGGFGLVQLTGNPKLKAEELRGWEAGYRAQLSKHVSLDVATFLNQYHNLQTTEPETPFFTTSPAPPHLVSPLVFGNTGRANTHGVEVFANWNVTNRWKLSPGWSAIHMTVIEDPSSQDTVVPAMAANTPQQQFQLRSSLNLARHLDWHTAMFYVGRLRDAGDGSVPAYTRFDTRVAWQLGESAEVSIDGQNLLRPSHAEFHNAYEVRRTLVQRSVFATFTWKF